MAVQTLGYYVKILRNRFKTIVIITSIFTIFSILLAFFILDPIFYSAAVVKTSEKGSGIAGLLGMSGGVELGDIGDFAAGGSSAKELALYENILMSRRCVEETIIKFNLMEEVNFKFMYDAVRHFRREIMKINQDKLAGTMEIGVFDKNPEKAKEMADFLVYQLNRINAEMNVLNAKNNREFLESRLTEVTNDLKQAEDSLIFYQNEFGIAPDITIQAAVKAELEVEAEIKSEEIKLELLRKILSPGEAEIKTQEEKIKALRSQLSDIRDTPSNRNSILGLKGSPDVVMDFIRIRRNVEIQNKILTTIIPLLEQAKIEEKRETPTVIILDPANIPDKKDKPRRMFVVLGFMFGSFFFTFGFFVVKEKYQEFKLNYFD